MSFLRSFLYQVIIFLVGIVVYYLKREKVADVWGRYYSPLGRMIFIYFMIIMWFGVLTFVRMYYDWPLLGIYYYLIPPKQGITVKEYWRHGLLGLSALGIILYRIAYWRK